MRTWVCFLSAACALLSVGPAMPLRAADEGGGANDCGVNCVYLLLNLQSCPVDLAELRRTLPQPGEGGISMAELQAASGKFGLPLRGAFITARDLPLHKPAIAFIENDRNNHFIVLSPVGETGTMVTVLDFPHPPKVVDYSSLISSPGWTGRVLLPSSTYEWGISKTLGFGILVAMTCLFFVKRAFLRFPRERPPFPKGGRQSLGL